MADQMILHENAETTKAVLHASTPEGATFGVAFRITRHVSVIAKCRVYIARDGATDKPLMLAYDLATIRAWCLAQHPSGAIEYDLNRPPTIH